MKKTENRWAPYQNRYQQGEWRARIFRDLILADVTLLRKHSDEITLLDIGCGRGFDDDLILQKSLASEVDNYIGIEPDNTIALADILTATHRCPFEQAVIQPQSIDLAFAVMVLEHFADPPSFWSKLHTILKPGGVFWGFTVDARHWFILVSLIMEKLGIKERYLNSLHGKPGEERYESYDAFYRCNTPGKLRQQTRDYSSCSVFNFDRPGQMDFYLPARLHFAGRCFEQLARLLGCPGAIMVVRVEKERAPQNYCKAP